MRISVDHGRCEGHGLCQVRAPQVYELDDDGVVVDRFAGRDVPAELETPAVDGAGVCPVAALSVLR